MKYRLKKRKNNEFTLVTNKESKTNSTTQVLKQNYPYILQSMKKENYKIEYDTFNIIQEIVYEEYVIGILSLINLESFDHVLCINEVYILPEYRNKGLFYETLLQLLSQPNISISLKNPNKKIIDLLIKYEFAKKLDNNLVISPIDFYVNYSKKYQNKNLKEYYNLFEKENQKELIKCNFYDLNINSCVFFDVDNIFEFNNNPIYIEKARQADAISEKYYFKLKNVDTTYLEILFQRLINVNIEIEKLNRNITNRINENLEVNDILGSETELTPIFIKLLKEHDLTIRDGFNIRQSIIHSLETNEIIPKSIILRTMYLIENIQHIDNKVNDKIELGYDFEEVCPYCMNIIYNFYEVCEECGFNIQRNNHFEENLPQIIGKNVFSKYLPSECILKEEIDYSKNKLNDIIYEDLNYLDYNKKEVYETQCKIATYQFLKEISEGVYFELFDYDTLNNIRQGSAFNYAKKRGYIKKLKDYKTYYEIMEIFFTNDRIRNILKRNNLNTNGSRKELIYRLESQLSPLDIFGKKYSITNKGYKFLEKHENYNYFTESLTRFSFYEVVQFNNEYKGSCKDFESSFIKFIEKISIENKDYSKYHNVIFYKLEKIKQEDHLKYLILFTKLFIIDLNYWLNNFEYEKGLKPLSIDIEMEYPNIKKFFIDEDIFAIYNEANNSIKIDSLKDKEDLSLFYLIKSLEYEDIEDINREIEHDIFEENYLKSLLNDNFL